VSDQAGAGGSNGVSLPLPQLVRDHPEVECTNCKNKGVKCTTEQILNPAKPNKGGKRIEEARKRFGGIGAEGSSSDGTPAGEGGDSLGGESLSATRSQTAEPSLDENVGELDWGAFLDMPGMDVLLAGLDTTGASTSAAPATAQPPSLDSTLDLSTFSFPTEHDLPGMPWETAGTDTAPSQRPPAQADGLGLPVPDDADSHFNFTHDNPVPLFALSEASASIVSSPGPCSSGQGQSRAASRTPDIVDASKSPFFHAGLVSALGQKDFEAFGIWSQLHPGAKAGVSPSPEQRRRTLGPRFQTASPGSSPGLDGHVTATPGLAPALPRSFKFDGGPTKFIPYDATPAEILDSQAKVFTNKVSNTVSNTSTALNPHATYRPQAKQSPLSMYFQPGQNLIPTGRETSLAPARKRQRSEYCPSSDSEDPWKLWSENGDELVRWGRREVVQQRLADRALGGELSKHLVMSYFHCVHPSFPVSDWRGAGIDRVLQLTVQALSPEGFYLEWERAGKVSERMTPAQEALCAVMEAWGARYSDSPVVLGLSPSRASMAPKGACGIE